MTLYLALLTLTLATSQTLKLEVSHTVEEYFVIMHLTNYGEKHHNI